MARPTVYEWWRSKKNGIVREGVFALLIAFALAFAVPASAQTKFGHALAAGPMPVAPAVVADTIQVELQTTGAPAQTFTIQPGWNYLTRSLGVHWFRVGTLDGLRFSNGVSGRQGGGFFFDRLVLRCSGRVQPLVVRPGEQLAGNVYTIAHGGGHWWAPRGVLSRRFVVGDQALSVPQVSRTLVPTGTPVTAFAAKLKALGTSRENRLRTALATGRVDTSVTVEHPAVGIWQPGDTHIGYAHGGRGLLPSPGYEQSFVYSALAADAMRERNTVDLLDAATGEPIPNPGGVVLADFANTRTRWGAEFALEFKVNPWYSTWGPKSWNTGSSPEYANLVAFQLIDGQHYGRAVRDDVACANLFADPLCAFNLKVSCLRAMEAWPKSRLDATVTKGVLGREFGWVAWTVAATRELHARGVVVLTRAQGAELDAWLQKAAAVFVRTQAAGLWQVEPYPWANWSPAPQSYNVPQDRGLGQSHEHGLLAMGAFAVWRQISPRSALSRDLGRAIMRASDVWTREGAPSALHWLVGKKAGAFQTLVTESFGSWDTVYEWSAATWANRVAATIRPSALEQLLGAENPGDKYRRAMLRISNRTPAAFVTQFSDTGPSALYLDWNIDAAVDMQTAILDGWTP